MKVIWIPRKNRMASWSWEECTKGFNFCERSRTKIHFWKGTTHNWGILLRFQNKRPNRSHLCGAPQN